MFSGLIKNIGIVESFNVDTIAIKSVLNPQIGASIAINGICTTVISTNGNIFHVALSKETRECVALENLQIPRAKVHLEEALRISDRLDGHIVQGHIDSIGEIVRVGRSENGFDFIIAYPSKIHSLLVPKGSITIDGVSLTLNQVDLSTFRLTIIPYTFNNTLFHTYKPKRRVNIETDIFNRSVYHILQNMESLHIDSCEDIRDLSINSNKSAESRWQKIDSILLSY